MKVLSPAELVEILKRYCVPEHGINVAGAMDEMYAHEIDVEQSCVDLCRDRHSFEWHYLGLIMLRGLLGREKSPRASTVELLLEMTKKFGQSDSDEFYKAFGALSHSPRYSRKLLDLAEYFVTAPVRDRNWLAMQALGDLLTATSTISIISKKRIRKLLPALTLAAEKEPDAHRRSQMFEAVENFRAWIEA